MKTYILTEKEIREIVSESYVCGIRGRPCAIFEWNGDKAPENEARRMLAVS